MHAPDVLTLLTTWLRRVLGSVLPACRLALGWSCIVVGAVVTISPIPFGFVIVIAGIALLGTRDRALRRARVRWKLLLRRCAASPQPALRAVGRWLRRLQQSLERQMRVRLQPARAPERAPQAE
jgi:hypothetical protein